MAAFEGNTQIVSLVLKHGADETRVGSSYPTASDVYPSALDAAHSDGSKADLTLLGLLEASIGMDPKTN